jgi:hypothetical protein
VYQVPTRITETNTFEFHINHLIYMSHGNIILYFKKKKKKKNDERTRRRNVLILQWCFLVFFFYFTYFLWTLFGFLMYIKKFYAKLFREKIGHNVWCLILLHKSRFRISRSSFHEREHTPTKNYDFKQVWFLHLVLCNIFISYYLKCVILFNYRQ